MIRRELVRPEPPQRDASLVFLNAIHRHAKVTRLHVTDLPPGSGRAHFQSRLPIARLPIERRCTPTVTPSSERPPDDGTAS